MVAILVKENAVSRVIKVFGIAATFIGTVIGAGFASGQEILQFFGRYGLRGLLGIGIATVIMGSATYKIFLMGIRLKSNSYRDFLLEVIDPKYINMADFCFFVFTLLLIGVMFAGCGAIFEQLQIGYWQGIVITAALLITILYHDLPGLMVVNMVVIPLMFLAALSIALFAMNNRSIPVLAPVTGLNWLLATLQFASYNVILAVPVLLAIAGQHPRKSLLCWGGWIGSVFLGLMTVLIYWALISHYAILSHADLPMVILAKIWGKPAFFGYILIIWGEMMTTLLANTYGLGKRVVAWTGWPFRLTVLMLISIGMGIAGLGFTNLIAQCYPIFGYLSIGVMLLVYLKPIPEKLIF